MAACADAPIPKSAEPEVASKELRLNDITRLAISLIEKRMKDAFPGIECTVDGTPKDLSAALDLAERDKYQFQWWAVSMVDALPFGGKKKGAPAPGPFTEGEGRGAMHRA